MKNKKRYQAKFKAKFIWKIMGGCHGAVGSTGTNEKKQINHLTPSSFHIGKGMLKNLGYRVTALKNSREALQAFQTEPEIFDLVITDLSMPYLTGTQLARKLMKIRPDIPIILCTGFSEMIDAKKAKSLGFREFVMKPMVISELAGTIRKVLDVKEQHHEMISLNRYSPKNPGPGRQ
jgi:CheY-like chemotaxis protein